jgi:hypothetical protein
VPLLVLLLLVLALFAPIVLMPLTILLRYRTGTARRLARGWVAVVNLLALGLSTSLFLLAAAITNLWVPRALPFSLLGLAAGALVGFLGLLLSRWEPGPRSLHYTPNRWLILGLTLVVASRMAYGIWRAWHAWWSTPDAESWLAASGAAGSLAAGGLVLGYYLAYGAGVWLRTRRHRRTWVAA